MGVPPTEFILDFYLKTSNIVPNGLCSLPDFPDPGVVSTYVCYGNIAPFPWSKSSSSAPAGFETVYKGWVALMQNGLSTDLPGAGTITAALASGDINGATSYWQNYLDVLGQQTFYSALYAIFTGASGYPIPNARRGRSTISTGSARSGSAPGASARSIRSASWISSA